MRRAEPCAAPFAGQLNIIRELRRGELLRLDVALHRDGSAELTASWAHLLFDGWGTKNEVERQQARTDSAAARLLAVGESTAMKAVQAYLDLRRFAQLRGISAESLTIHKRILCLMPGIYILVTGVMLSQMKCGVVTISISGSQALIGSSLTIYEMEHCRQHSELYSVSF